MIDEKILEAKFRTLGWEVVMDSLLKSEYMQEYKLEPTDLSDDRVQLVLDKKKFISNVSFRQAQGLILKDVAELKRQASGEIFEGLAVALMDRANKDGSVNKTQLIVVAPPTEKENPESATVELFQQWGSKPRHMESTPLGPVKVHWEWNEWTTGTGVAVKDKQIVNIVPQKKDFYGKQDIVFDSCIRLGDLTLIPEDLPKVVVVACKLSELRNYRDRYWEGSKWHNTLRYPILHEGQPTFSTVFLDEGQFLLSLDFPPQVLGDAQIDLPDWKMMSEGLLEAYPEKKTVIPFDARKEKPEKKDEIAKLRKEVEAQEDLLKSQARDLQAAYYQQWFIVIARIDKIAGRTQKRENQEYEVLYGTGIYMKRVSEKAVKKILPAWARESTPTQMEQVAQLESGEKPESIQKQIEDLFLLVGRDHHLDDYVSHLPGIDKSVIQKHLDGQFIDDPQGIEDFKEALMKTDGVKGSNGAKYKNLVENYQGKYPFEQVYEYVKNEGTLFYVLNNGNVKVI